MASPVDSCSPFIALLAISLLLCSATASPPPAPASECVNELVMFSPCLAFVSSPPNNLSAAASSSCCDAFSAVLGSSCLCYLIREPRMLGFPIDEARVLSLPLACARNDHSLEALCSGNEALPPSQNATESGISSPPASAPSTAPSPSMSFSPEPGYPTESPSLSPDSQDSSEISSPSSEIADMLLPRPRSPPTPSRFSASASANHFVTTKYWTQMGSLAFPLVYLFTLQH